MSVDLKAVPTWDLLAEIIRRGERVMLVVPGGGTISSHPDGSGGIMVSGDCTKNAICTLKKLP